MLVCWRSWVSPVITLSSPPPTKPLTVWAVTFWRDFRATRRSSKVNWTEGHFIYTAPETRDLNQVWHTHRACLSFIMKEKSGRIPWQLNQCSSQMFSLFGLKHKHVWQVFVLKSNKESVVSSQMWNSNSFLLVKWWRACQTGVSPKRFISGEPAICN